MIVKFINLCSTVMWIDEHVVKKTLCVLPANSFLLKKGKLGRNLHYIVTA